MNRTEHLSRDLKTCTTVDEVLNRVKEEIKNGPPDVADNPSDQPAKLYHDPGIGLDMFVMNVKKSKKKIGWIKATTIVGDNGPITNTVSVYPNDSVIPSLMYKLWSENPKYGFIDIEEGGPIDIHKFHRFVLYRKYPVTDDTPDKERLELESKEKTALLLAGALVKYIKDINEMKKNYEDKFVDWLLDSEEQRNYHIIVGLLHGYTFNDIAFFLKTNGIDWN